MRFRSLVSAGLLAAFAAGCSTDDILEVDPKTIVPAETAISDAQSARAALLGLYDALQSDSYYGEQFLTFGDLSADNTQHTGTYTEYADADANRLNSANSAVEGMWAAIYSSIARANVIIERIPEVNFLEQAEKDQQVATALFVRALGYHNLVKYYGGVPLRTEPVSTPSQVSELTRATPAQVYAQVLADLQQAQSLVKVQRAGLQVSLGAIRALRARVYLYQQNWTGAETEANAVLAMGYALASSYPSLFDEVGAPTSEDIFRVKFSSQDAGSLSYYYMDKSLGGRREVGPTSNLRNSFETGDARAAWSIRNATATRFYGAKFRSVTGTEHTHVIRLGEILLIKAEAQARLGRLAEAIATINPLRRRAGLAELTFGATNLTTQQQVLDAIWRERRAELVFEGDRWPDLVRTGQVVTVMSLAGREYQALYPIPQGERDVTRGLDQNPGY
ncbi:MAG TPA: RagB/SusD family nutrient uptake outer membrane protein [Gemmatimonadaceae bacterium]|nr:RagB/SusD family nutrient uptake outer membrane protein [Gemmatimonadaceae bacterium]